MHVCLHEPRVAFVQLLVTVLCHRSKSAQSWSQRYFSQFETLIVFNCKLQLLHIHDVLCGISLTVLTKFNSFRIAFILHSLKRFCFDVVKILYLANTSVLLCNLKITSSNYLTSKLIMLS